MRTYIESLIIILMITTIGNCNARCTRPRYPPGRKRANQIDGRGCIPGLPECWVPFQSRDKRSAEAIPDFHVRLQGNVQDDVLSHLHEILHIGAKRK